MGGGCGCGCWACLKNGWARAAQAGTGEGRLVSNAARITLHAVRRLGKGRTSASGVDVYHDNNVCISASICGSAYQSSSADQRYQGMGVNAMDQTVRVALIPTWHSRLADSLSSQHGRAQSRVGLWLHQTSNLV